jgi:hypothetical protein
MVLQILPSYQKLHTDTDSLQKKKKQRNSTEVANISKLCPHSVALVSPLVLEVFMLPHWYYCLSCGLLFVPSFVIIHQLIQKQLVVVVVVV